MSNLNYNALYFPLKMVFFYLIWLNIWRILFMYYNDVEKWGTPIINGLRLDISLISYILIIMFIPWLLYLMTGINFIKNIINVFSQLIWILVCIIELGSVLIFPEWGTTVNHRAVSYLHYPGEAWASIIDFIDPLTSIFGLLILFAGLKWIKTLFRHWQPVRSYYVQSYGFVLVLIPILVIGIRGGIQKLPVKPADAFYSPDMKNNFAAVNKCWYLGYSVIKNKELTVIHDDETLQYFRNENFRHACTHDSLRPDWRTKNIVILIMEGWSYNMVNYLGSNETITPFFDSLSRYSIRFTNAFSSGFRTDQGIISILSGIPSVGGFNMANQPEKTRYYPSITSELKNIGYKTSFIYGGDLNFSNLNTYLLHSKFENIISEKDFSSGENTTDWGVPDHITAQKAANVMNQSSGKPIFSVVLFLSSHAPFETPVANSYSGKGDIKSDYKASVMYSDWALSRFFTQVKHYSWFKNCVFIITSDHGSAHALPQDADEHNKFRIPMIIYEPNLTEEADFMDIPCNHFDLPFTITQRLGISSESFQYGRDIFCADSVRSAYWHADHNCGVYNRNAHETILGDQKGKHPVLFFDSVRKWYNGLGKVE